MLIHVFRIRNVFENVVAVEMRVSKSFPLSIVMSIPVFLFSSVAKYSASAEYNGVAERVRPKKLHL